MKFTRDWLQNYVDLGELPPEQLADELTMVGLEVDSVTELYEKLSDLKTGRVLTVEPHPNADKLTLCTVSVGQETLQIICGAPNVREGLGVVVALPGTVLPGDFKIKKSKVRGVESQGMLCSERELGLSEEHHGIMELGEEIEPGLSFVEATGLKDIQIEVDLTPNRPDCASVIGVARETAGILRKKISVPFKNTELAANSSSFAVEVENPELCPRYAARLIQGITIGPSPWWLRKRLLSVGLRPINNVVDITNFVMLEYGQPLHAFDFDTLADKKIVVRTPRPEEKTFTTLDNVERTLDDDMLMICDGKEPVAVGGVMGGLYSEVTEKTVNVLLESACFNDVSIRKTARKLNLSTDASYRFERGVDPEGTIDAMERAVTLMVEIAGGTAEQGGIDVRVDHQPVVLSLRASRSAALLGVDLGIDELAELINSIEIGCQKQDEDTLRVVVPSFRVDLEREADLIEEIARLYGFNRIPITLPGVDLSFPEQDEERIKRNQASLIMTDAGFSEAINYSFVSNTYDDALLLDDSDVRRRHVRLLNPLTEDQDVMRTTLLPGLLENIRRNLNYQQTSCYLFEIGKVFLPVDGELLPEEPLRIAGVLTGNRNGAHAPLHFKAEETDLSDAKGAVETLLSGMRLNDHKPEQQIGFTTTEPHSSEPYCEEGYGINVVSGSTAIGTLGKLKNDILLQLGIKRDVYYFDLDFSALVAIEPAPKTFSPLPVYPSVKRDIALVVPTSVPAGDLIQTVFASGEKLVEHCELFDVYQGDKIGSGMKSVALSITFRSATRTLTEKNVEKAHAKVMKLLTDKYGGALREE
ncbi:MAG: phenylalanine--tRNA ligase subunit beta [Desulfofustis sp.]|nr:phenylalanine--tRNA ligase subunit beta [Desulfofustis sp.]